MDITFARAEYTGQDQHCRNCKRPPEITVFFQKNQNADPIQTEYCLPHFKEVLAGDENLKAAVLAELLMWRLWEQRE